MLNHLLGRLGFSALLWALFSLPVLADGEVVALLYPELREPFRSVFEKIINGIEAGAKAPIKAYILTEDDSTLKTQLQQERPQTVITLGRAGLLMARKLEGALPVVVGAAFISPSEENQGLAGISLSPDSSILFDKLKKLAPEVKQVTVIYDPRHKEWEIERARKAAKERGLTLNALPAEDLRSAAALYRSALDNSKSNSSAALWLLQDDSTMDERALLPLILKEAWESNLVVFSSNPDHVRKGALFSMFPDNAGMGRSLAAMANNRAVKGANIELLRDLLLAVNIRTAEHLGLNFDSQDRREFAMVFPAP